MEVVTGVNANAMGQYNSGRRSASEARVVTAGAAGRMKMHGQLIWDTSLGPAWAADAEQFEAELEFGGVSGGGGRGSDDAGEV